MSDNLVLLLCGFIPVILIIVGLLSINLCKHEWRFNCYTVFMNHKESEIQCTRCDKIKIVYTKDLSHYNISLLNTNK